MLERFTWYRQSAYRFEGDGLRVYIDPWGLGDDEGPADVIFLTHAHYDHLSPEDLAKIRTDRTRIVAPPDVAAEVGGEVTAVAAGDSIHVSGISGQAVPAYNIIEERLSNHPKAKGWVGYILTIGEHTYYHAGDTDHLDELEGIRADVSFVPIGGTYTMDPDEAAALVRTQSPKVAVPMHYGYVVGSPSFAERFRQAASPVEVRTLDPRNPFERQ